MRRFFDEYRRISERDLPKEIHMGWFPEKCKCGCPIGMKANPVGLDKGIFTQYCTGCKKEFFKFELEGDELLEGLIEFVNRLMGGVA
jgi:hypothetical protein